MISVLMTVLTRKFEYQADKFAMGLGFKDSLITGLVRLHIRNKSNLNPDRLYSMFHHSHPTLVERLKELDYDGKAIKLKIVEED